ncbi:hypothetical protein J1G35_09870 [Pseudomonas sp. SH10-3B]|uniref:hypothetical protein n=1 Tax=Pseudomonas sp. SH10-3B TaxID=2816049 RepID=UPI001CA70EB8|nr:hypothetical protein [Pseudomonas sp. SH10-3B]MBY8946174.1 hypothetical protein [Pseudomonas sp. SH10-3B]
MPITSFHSLQTMQHKVDFYTEQKNSIETRIQHLQDVQANIQKNAPLAAKFSTESDRAAKQLTSKDRDEGYLRQRSDGTPRLTRHMGLMVRATRLVDGALGSNLSARSSMLDGGFRKALGDAERLDPILRNVVDSPYKKITVSQFADIGSQPAINTNQEALRKDLNVTLEKLASWKQRLDKKS